MSVTIARVPALSPAAAVGAAALAAAAFDAVECTLVYGRYGVPPARILQGVAAGLLGRDAARAGGWATAALGAVLLLAICGVIVAIYVAASRRLAPLVERWWLWGPVYGAAAFVVMQFVVVPLSAAGGGGSSFVGLVNGLAVSAVAIGPAAALAARASRGWTDARRGAPAPGTPLPVPARHAA
jgi:hypothetical protein